MPETTSGDRLYFIHSVPRRTRLKVPARRRDAAFFATLARRLEAMEGINSVTASPATASIVVHHAPAFQWRAIRLESMGLRLADTRSESACPTCHKQGARVSSLPTVCEWAVSAAFSGQPVATLVTLAASGLIQSALVTMLASDPAAT